MQLAVITVASHEYFRIENSLVGSMYEMYTDDLKIDHLEYPITVFLEQKVRCKIILAWSGEPNIWETQPRFLPSAA